MSVLYPCLNCLNVACLDLKNDVKGRPYSTCRMCTTRSFMHSPIAFRGLTHFSPTLINFWREASAGATLRQLDDQIEAARRVVTPPLAKVG